MKIGDLVTYWYQRPRWLKGQSVHVGLVIETGVYTGNTDVKVLWTGYSDPTIEATHHLSLIDDSLTSS